MMIGTVHAGREAVISVPIRDAQGQDTPVDCVIDTGFTGFLTLPPSTVSSWGLTWVARSKGRLADGSIQAFEVYAATVLWDGVARVVEVIEADGTPLLGMQIMAGFALHIEVVNNGRVEISRLP
jgi:clan AA aspartic protease